MNKIKVMIVDDSELVHSILSEIINSDPELEIVAHAYNGKEAVNLVEDKKPNIIIMDVQMPEMDGFEATEKIMAYNPTPILIFSSAVDRNEKYSSFQAISLGALDVMSKPDLQTEGIENIGQKIISRLKLLARIKVIPHIRGKIKELKKEGRELDNQKNMVESINLQKADYEIVGIGASTGGPSALERLFSFFPADFPLPIVVVQHIARGFIQSFCEWLQHKIHLKVKVAENGEKLLAGTVYFAPDDCQMLINADRTVMIDNQMPPWGEHKPSVNHLFRSLAINFHRRVIAVILTGMGDDGAEGMKEIFCQHGLTIAQSQDSCLIFGMPRAAIEKKAVQIVAPLENIYQEIRKYV